MSQQALPFRLLGAADLDAFRIALERPVARWAAEWFSSAKNIAFEIVDAVPGELAEAEDWSVFCDPAGCGLAWRLPERRRREFVEALLGAPLPPGGDASPMIEALLAECLQDLGARLLAIADAAAAPERRNGGRLDSTWLGYGAGAACALPDTASLCPDLVFSGELVERIVARPRPAGTAGKADLVQRENAIGNRRARVEVVLGTAELTLADLANVSSGDVIRLQSRFREPLLVRSQEGVPLFSANLGAADASKAIQIVGRAS
ncbi:MAG: FliM/FliN family flagellar motor switch protein [Rhodocyclales bacterium]|nr:FliM/FliN family flagellar motor switch protein [Rhodocyclales bacterium]